MIWRILLLLAALGYIGMLVYRTIRFVPPKEERRRPSRAPAIRTGKGGLCGRICAPASMN